MGEPKLILVGLPDAGQDRRRRIVLDVDHELTVARAFLARFGLGRIDDLPRRHEFGN